MAKKCVRSCSISILIRENKIKLTARYHCTLTKMAWIEKIYNTKYCRASKTSEYLLIKCCIEVSDKFRHKSTYDQTNSNPVYISKKNGQQITKTCVRIFVATVFIIASN